MKTSTIIVLLVVVLCIIIVVVNRYHHRHHHYNVDKLDQTIKDILHVQPEKMMKRSDFIIALEHTYNCPKKEALWLMGYANEHDIIKYDEQWVELNK